MNSLTQTAYFARKSLKIALILFVFLLISKTAFEFIVKAWKTANPPPPPPPTVAFGKLPKIDFPQKKESEFANFTYKLETIDGGLPQLPNIGKVYFMPQKGANLLALERASQQVQKMGFKGEPEKIDEINYRWKTENQLPTIIEMNINTGNFYFKYDYANDPELLASTNLPTNQQAATEAKNFLANNGLMPADLENGSAEFEYLRLESTNLKPVISLSEANFVRVNLFRGDLDEWRILPPDPRKSLINFLFSSSRATGKRIVEISYTYFPAELETSSTYPLRPISQAWEDLKNGKTYLAHTQITEGLITIRKVYLAYFDSGTPQRYLQPIYVFEGDGSFFAYTSALESTWVE